MGGQHKKPHFWVICRCQRWHRHITQKRGFLFWPALASTNYPKMWFFKLASAGIDKLPKNVFFYVGQRWHRQITQKCGFLSWPALASTNYPKMWFFMLASAGIDKLPKNVVFYVGQRWHRQITQKCVFLCWPALAKIKNHIFG